MTFPTTFVDNVFENPDAVREFALNQKFNRELINKNYPGNRTRPIGEICLRLDEQIISTIISQFYDEKNTKINVEYTSFFQLIPKENSDNGLVHRDHNCILTAVTYLNKNDHDWGTAICHPIVVDLLDGIEQEKINRGFNSRNDKNWNSYVDSKNLNYKEILRVNNVYNNMIIFNGYKAHRAILNNPNASEDRLTIVTFIHELYAPNNPLIRSKMSNSFV